MACLFFWGVNGECFGNDTFSAALAEAAVGVVIAMPDSIDVRRMVNTAHTLNPGMEIAMRTHNEAEAKPLESENAGKIFLGEEELAQAMTRHVLERSAAVPPRAQGAALKKFRSLMSRSACHRPGHIVVDQRAQSASVLTRGPVCPLIGFVHQWWTWLFIAQVH